MAGDSCSYHASDTQRSVERLTLIIWTVWGVIVAALVLWLDKNPLIATACFAAAVAYGYVARYLFRWVVSPLMNGYQRFWIERLHGGRSWELIYDTLDAPEFKGLVATAASQKELESLLNTALSRAPNAQEYKRRTDEEMFGLTLGTPVFFALIHGSLGGGLLGALAPLDPNVHLPASEGAALGVLLGPIAMSFLAAIVIAVMPMPKEMPRLTWPQRALVLVSPFLVVPIAWQCLTRQRLTGI